MDELRFVAVFSGGRKCFGGAASAKTSGATRPGADRGAGVRETGPAVSGKTAIGHVLGDVVRALPRRISHAGRVGEAVGPAGTESRRRQRGSCQRLNPDAAL